jgi:ribosomal protein S18 acetylase RimI-like enzyme
MRPAHGHLLAAQIRRRRERWDDAVVSEVTVGVLGALDPSSYRSICCLLPQLTSTAAEPTFDELAEMLDPPGTHLVVARAGDEVLGMLTLIVLRLPSARVAHIEDVVVDQRCRGQGIGGRLIEAALSLAAAAGARHVDLTSRPSRVEANRLYTSLGFQARETNVYRYPIPAD